MNLERYNNIWNLFRGRIKLEDHPLVVFLVRNLYSWERKPCYNRILAEYSSSDSKKLIMWNLQGHTVIDQTILALFVDHRVDTKAEGL